eukprot:10110539-Alexandrium_andersonii.AAC.1
MSPTSALPGSTCRGDSSARSYTAAPRPSRPTMRGGMGRPARACWAAAPRGIAVQSAGGWTAARA